MGIVERGTLDRHLPRQTDFVLGGFFYVSVGRTFGVSEHECYLCLLVYVFHP